MGGMATMEAMTTMGTTERIKWGRAPYAAKLFERFALASWGDGYSVLVSSTEHGAENRLWDRPSHGPFKSVAAANRTVRALRADQECPGCRYCDNRKSMKNTRAVRVGW